MDLIMFCVWMYLHAILATMFVAVPAYGDKEPRVKTLHACTDIKYRFATTRITSHVINPTNQSRQAVFDVTLPNDAFISNFTLTLDGETYGSRVVQKDEAVRQFGSSVSQPEGSSGRVSQRPRETNQFRVTLKVAPHQGVTFNLTYQEILERRLGSYDYMLYIDPGQPVEDMRIDVSIEENREISYLHVPPIRSDLLTDYNATETNSLVRVHRPSARQAHVTYHPSAHHQQAQGKSQHGLSGLFTVQYDVNRTMDAGELLSVNGYFVHFIAPPVVEPIPKDVLFILDTSTSMMREKLGQLQDALRVILNDLNPGDRFALMQFNSRATFWRRELLPVTPTTIEWAMEYVGSLKARGYTNIHSAVEQGLDFLNKESTVKGNNSLIIFLTDGRPTRGVTNEDVILDNARTGNGKQVAVYGLAFGKDADWPLIKRLTAQNQGIGRRIYQDADASLQIQGFYSEVSTLLLTGVQALYLDSEVDVATLTKTFFPKYFNGSELVVAGKLIRQNQTELQVLVQGTGQEGKVNLTLVPDPDPAAPGQVESCGLLEVGDLTTVAEKMWAYFTIRQMLQQRVGEDDEKIKQQQKDKATQLALRYGFVTPFTSLLVGKKGEEELASLWEDASDLLDERDELMTEDIITETTKAPSTAAKMTTSVESRTTPADVTPTAAISETASTRAQDLHEGEKAPSTPHSDSELTTVSDKSSHVAHGLTSIDNGTFSTGPDQDGRQNKSSSHDTDILRTGDKNASSSPGSEVRTVEKEESIVKGGGSLRGGGGGDPHFMVEMKSLPYPLCYDVTGKAGDVYRLLKDPHSGLTVNVEMDEGRWTPPNSARPPLYITRAAILLQDVIVEVTAQQVIVNDDTVLQWDTEHAVYVPGVWVMMKITTLRFALDWNVEIDVTRYVRDSTDRRRINFLNIEIQNEAHLSKDSTGLLGQFVNKEVSVQRVKRRRGRLVAELDIRTGARHRHVTHGRALLKTRRDPFFKRKASCLMVDWLWSHALVTPTRLHRVKSIFEV